MGGKLGSKSSSSQSIKEYFDQLFSYFLSLGMSYKEFWEDDVELINYYYEAEKIRQSKMNNQIWLQGAYIRMAIASCLDKHAKYPKEPIPLTEQEIEEVKQQRIMKLQKALIAKSKK